jgi:hypothetical protein
MRTRNNYSSGFLLFALSLTFVPAMATPHKDLPPKIIFARLQNEKSSPLEVHITAPLRWENGCLHVSLDRIDKSLTPLFLPNKGIYIFTSVTEVPDESGKKKGVEWINIYGFTDIGDWEAEPIAPGKAVHSEVCLYPTIPVINLEKHTWREIAVRGRLRIDAYYFLTKRDWLTNKAQHEEMFKLSGNELKRMKVLYPQATTIFSPIPCSDNSCASNCEEPPTVLYGESRVVPDVYQYEREWVVRGNAINEEIRQKTRPCSGSKSTSP